MTDHWKKGIIICADQEAEAAASAKLDPQVRALWEAGKPDAVEELLLSRVSEAPLDLRLFVPVLRHFVKNDKTETAQMFLDFLLDAVRSRKADAEELSLLRALLLAWPEALPVRTSLVDKLRGLYGDTPNIKILIKHCRIFDPGVEPLSALRALEHWLRFNLGRGVYMPKKGTGRISEINPALETVRAVFPGSAAPLSFKLDEAARLLEPLPPGHFLLATIDNPESLRELAITDSGEFLRRLFLSVNRPLSLNELKDMCSGIVNAERWSSWWSSARKDRRLTVTAGNECVWNDSVENAESSILEQFKAAPVHERMETARRYAGRSPALAAAMKAQLVNDARTVRENNPGLALELLLTLDKPADTADSRTMLADLLSAPEAPETVLSVQNRLLRKRALAMLRESRKDWPALYALLIRSENDAQLLTYLYDSLRGNSSDALDGIVAETMSSPAKAGHFFIWLCREINTRTELQHFADWQLLQIILQLLTDNAMKKHQATLKKLFAEDGIFHQTARHLTPEQAKFLLDQLDRDTVLEDYRRERLCSDLRAWYPQADETGEKTFYVSPEALKIRQEEFVKLTGVEIPRNTEEIIKARAHGDLRENFEYHAARARQEMLSSRAKTLHDELQSARPIERSKIDPSTVCIGTTAHLLPVENGADDVIITILGPWDSAPAQNIISYLAPAAAGLLGRARGAQVTFNGKCFKIADIAVYSPS
jgi:transcription elongation factor GreA